MFNPEYDVNELVQNPSFRAWVTGEASKKEKLYWDQWVQESEDNRTLALQAQNEIIGFTINATSVPNTVEAWKMIDSQVEEEKVAKQSRFYSRKRKRGWWYAAASLLLLAMVGYIYASFDQMTQTSENPTILKVATQYEEQKKILLSDGSTILLNAHSTLHYAANQSLEEGVRIFLEGEAYFKVASRTNPAQPSFMVITEDGSIAVRGTRFAVSTRSSHTRVVLEHGKVVVQPSGKNSGPKTTSVLNPNEMAIFETHSDEVKVESVNTAVYTSWTTDALVFDHTPFREVIKRLEYTFGKQVLVQDPSLLDRPISGSVANTDVEAIAKALAKILNTKVVIKTDSLIFGY